MKYCGQDFPCLQYSVSLIIWSTHDCIGQKYFVGSGSRWNYFNTLWHQARAIVTMIMAGRIHTVLAYTVWSNKVWEDTIETPTVFCWFTDTQFILSITLYRRRGWAEFHLNSTAEMVSGRRRDGAKCKWERRRKQSWWRCSLRQIVCACVCLAWFCFSGNSMPSRTAAIKWALVK